MLLPPTSQITLKNSLRINALSHPVKPSPISLRVRAFFMVLKMLRELTIIKIVLLLLQGNYKETFKVEIFKV